MCTGGVDAEACSDLAGYGPPHGCRVRPAASMSTEPRADAWASGAAYDPFMGRWSRQVAREFLRWLAVPVGQRWLEVGCGTGAVTGTIMEMAAPALLIAADRSS